jgi:type II secretory pathway component GspD/PulD (secretin)
MVARAKARSWNKLKLVAGLVVGAALPPWAAAEIPLEVGPPATLVAQLQGRSNAAHGALTGAIESQRRGDYDTADVLLRDAQAGQEELSPTERQELARAVQTNAAVLKVRREAGEMLRQADKALMEGKAQQAADLLKAVAANEQYLAPFDRQHWQQLSERAKQKTTGTTAPPAPASANPADNVKATLRQARAQLALANFDAAEALAKSCARPGVTYAKGEDTPQKVLDDCRKQRSDAKFILSAARAALERNELDRAEELAKAADKVSGLFTFPVWADSPSQCFKDIQTARAKKPAAADKTAASATGRNKPESGDASKKPADLPAPTKAPDPKVAAANTEKARALLVQARKALQGGDMAQAKKLNEEARALKPELSWWEENPEKLHSDIVRAEAHAKAQAPADKIAKPAPGENKEAAVALVKQGRVQLAEGKLDEATQSVLKAKAMTSVHWGLFDMDSPEKLGQDVEKARGKRDRDESEKVLAEARHLYEKKEYENAERAAYRAQKLHGPYSVWDFGDRPSKLLAEIETARSKERKINVPAPTDVVVKKDDKVPPAVNAKEGPAVGTPPPNPADVARARLMLSDARVALKNGDAAGAKALAEQVKRMPVRFDRPGEDNADAVLRDVDAMVAVRGNPAPRNQGLVTTSYQQTTNPAVAPAADAAKVQARAMLAEARKLQGQGRLLEARQMAVETQNLRVVFAPDEDSPERLLLQLGSLARQRIDGLMVQANDLVNSAKGDPAAWQRKAEENLIQARQLALAFGQDVQPVEAKLQWLHGLRGGPAPAPVVQNGLPGATNQGRELLDKARMELRSGQTATARKLANEACNEAYGVREEALAVLRTLDNEEFNQRRIAVNRTFDAAAAAFNRREYGNSYGIITSIDVRLLDEVRQARLREIMQTPEMAAARNQGQPPQEAKAPATVLAGGPGTALPPLGNGDPRLSPPGKASASDANPEQDTLKRMEALRNVKFQALRQESLDLQKSAAEKFRTGQTDAAIEMLQEFVARLDKEQLDPGQISMLKRPVDSRLTRFKLLKAQEDIKNGTDATARAGFAAHSSKVLAEQKKQRNVAELMKQYNALLQDGKYLEAESIAMKAHELDPDNYMVSAAITMAKYQSRIAINKSDKDQKEAFFWNVMRDTEKGAPALTIDNPLDVTTVDKAKLSGRKGSSLVTTKRSEKEREIENRLYTPVNLNFTDTPLKTVLDDLRSWQGINIYVDQEALDAEAISIDRPVTIKLEQVALRSALPLLLKSAHLTYVIKDDVLQITTEAHAKGRRETRTFGVGDLVNAIPNFGSVQNPLKPPSYGATPGPDGSSNVPSPVVAPGSLSTGAPVGNPTGSQLSSFPNTGSSGQPTQTITKSNPTGTMEESLIRLITSSVAPQSWADMGGTGTIEYFAPTMALVINQTPDIQEEIAALLAALRRLQDQEVSIEVRLITISEEFFERIGVNFNVNIPTENNKHFGQQLEAGQLQQTGLIQIFQPKSFLTGLTPAGTFTSDLNIPIANQSFGGALPPFGGYSGIPGVGGLSLGLAFLSDIQVFLFLEAVQGDQRANIMQAPKLSLFNGQTSTISVTDTQNFLTSVLTGFFNGVPVFQPTFTGVPTGIPNLAMQAIISADRRFVRMSMSITLSNLASDVVPLIPVVVPIFQGLDGFQAGQPVVFTQFVQTPRVTTLMVDTTVAVPDGGTVLMGGWKRLSEGRTEFGPPVLSKIPYVNRLFKNVGYGREAESLLIMVTPRIIIMEEEEARALGNLGPGIEVTR